MRTLVIFLLGLCFGYVSAQEINQTDADGERHGIWKKNFEGTDQPRYEGQFEHGKEIGLFKYYQLIGRKSKLAATRSFNKDGTAIVKFYTVAGKVISEGKMRGKTYIGQWTYYHKNSDVVMTVENYDDDGLLHGLRVVHYDTQQKAEEVNYVNGLREGQETHYALNGNVVKIYNYVNDQLHGPTQHFDDQKNLILEGQYKNDKKVGIWKYYSNGKLLREKNWSHKPKRNKRG